MYSYASGNMLSMIATIVVIFVAVVCCCSSDDNTSSSSASRKTNVSRQPRRNTHYNRGPYCECPSCGAPYFDGYCEECGYPDVNLGWVGENY